MKFFVFILSVVLIACTGTTTLKANEGTDELLEGELIELKLSNGVGYLTKNEGVKLLEKIKMAEEHDKGWGILKENDTIGKYIKSKETGHYIVCILDVQEKFDFETHVLIELELTAAKTYRVIAKERYVHGNYACCWSNYHAGFNQMDDYFTFESCSTGSGFCGTNTYWFKQVLPQDSLKSIPESYSSSFENSTLELTSKKILEDDVLTVYYRMENHGLEKKNVLPAVVDTFSIVYKFKNNTWFCDDKKLERLRF